MELSGRNCSLAVDGQTEMSFSSARTICFMSLRLRCCHQVIVIERFHPRHARYVDLRARLIQSKCTRGCCQRGGVELLIAKALARRARRALLVATVDESNKSRDQS
jgi:hypothetical protein